MKRLFYSISILSALFLSSCSTDEVTNRTTTPPTGTIDVYTAGTYIDDQYVHYAIYNKNNGTNIYLTGGIEANGIYVEGNDVYVAGIGRDSNDNNAAVYWKNGVKTQLEVNPFNNSQAQDICVHNGDVYVTGIDTDGHPVYWMNGVKTTLSTAISSRQSKHKIKFVGNDMYINGDIEIAQNTYRAVYWKNGVQTILPQSAAGVFLSISCGIDINNANDVYVAGGVHGAQVGYPVYWKNGVEIPVTGFTPSSIKVNGNDVYMVGNSYGITPNAVVWENGVVATLPQSYFANDIALLNNTTYITGKSDNFVDENLASWTNNVVALGENRTEGKAVFVVQN